MTAVTESALVLIEHCLKTGGDYMDGYDSKDREPNVVIRDGAKYYVYDTRGGYPLNLKTVTVLAYHEHRTKDNWDGDFASYCIFKFDKGLGVAYNTGWWGPTFGEDQYDLDIQEDHDWKKFFDFVLTDELRKKLELVAESMEVDVAEMILLNKECDE